MATHVLCLLVIVTPVFCANEHGREGLVDHISNGMKFATDFLGSESVAQKVAEFVVRAFQNTNRPSQPIRRRPSDTFAEDTSEQDVFEKKPIHSVNEGYSPMTPLKQLVKLFGLQPSQVSAVAINALVFVAQMISTFLAGPKRGVRPYRFDDPTSWILNKKSKTLQDLIETAKNETLPDTIEELFKQQGNEEETSCIRLLVCKITPFVARMQKAVFGNETVDRQKFRGSAGLYRHLPSQEEIDSRGNVCEQRYKDCDLDE